MLGKRKSYNVENGIIHFAFEYGKGSLEVLTDNIVNVFVPFECEEHRSKAIEGEKSKHIHFDVQEGIDYLEVRTAKLIIRVYDNFMVDFYDVNGQLLCADYRGGRKFATQISEKFIEFLKAEGHEVTQATDKNYHVQAVKRMEGDEAFYGFGDKAGVLNKKNYDYEMWNTDNPAAHTEAFKALYKSIPFFIALRESCVYGIFFDNSCKSYFDLAKENKEYYFFGSDRGNLDYYFIAGDNMPEVVADYTYLTGRTPLPQLYTLGYHQSRWGYETSAEIRAIADKYRALKIPIDTIHLDIDYMDGYRVFTWNEKDFGRPGEVIADLKKKGFKIVTIIDPGVKLDPGYDMYDEGMEQGYFAKTQEGDTYVNAVWPGDAVYPDFGNPKVRQWWGEKQKYLVDLGVRGVWNDMNEPASFTGPLPDDVQFEYGAHEKVHNIYGHFMAKATYEGLAKNDGGKRPFVLTRAAYAGSQKYCGGWTGDNHSIWAHIALSLEQVCNLSVSGLAMCGSDIGGFGSDTTPELLVRFYEAAVFVPFFRNHSAMGTRRQEPWQFDETTIDAVRKTVKLRYRFIPYIYDLAHECEKTGAPIVRPLVYEYPADKHVRNISDEYMLGSFVLVAPVIAPGKEAREVYLPDGDWYDYYTGEKYSGGRYILADAPLDKVPVFIKAGAIIPVADGEIRSTEDITEDKISILTYPGKGSFVHYQDDNETFAYRNGEYNAVEYTLDGDKLEKKVLHKGL